MGVGGGGWVGWGGVGWGEVDQIAKSRGLSCRAGVQMHCDGWQMGEQ